MINVNTLKVGDRVRYIGPGDQTAPDVVEEVTQTGIAVRDPAGARIWWTRSAFPRFYAPDAEVSHPADLKPRTGKDPLHLVPWSVVPEGHTPLPILLAAAQTGVFPDGDPCEAPHPDDYTFAEALLDHLLSEGSISEMAAAFAYGAAKYKRDNWRTFEWDAAAEDCYWAAICRHLDALMRGEDRAEDSGVSHRGHAMAGCAIWIWHERRRAAGRAPWAAGPDGSGVRPSC